MLNSKLRNFFLEEIFYKRGYQMPLWLYRAAEEDRYFLENQHLGLGDRILDIGCGNFRATRYLGADLDIQVFKCGTDIYNIQDIPRSYRWHWACNNMEYKQLEYDYDNMAHIPDFNVRNNRFDLIVCYGVDYLLSEEQTEIFIKESFERLRYGGTLIWQTTRQYTLSAMRLRIHDKEIPYIYKSKDFYKRTMGNNLVKIGKTPLSTFYRCVV